MENGIEKFCTLSGKREFSKAGAKAEARKRMSKGTARLYVYQCPCLHYHLTSVSPDDLAARRKKRQ